MRPSGGRPGTRCSWGHGDGGSAGGDVTSALCNSTIACFFSSTSSCSRITDVLTSDAGSRRPSPSSGTGPWRPLHTWGAEAGGPCPDFSISSRKLIILCSLASESRGPSSRGQAATLSFPNFSRLSAVRELESSSCGGRGRSGRLWAGLLGAAQGPLGQGRAWSGGRASQAAQTLAGHPSPGGTTGREAVPTPPPPLGYSGGPKP